MYRVKVERLNVERRREARWFGASPRLRNPAPRPSYVEVTCALLSSARRLIVSETILGGGIGTFNNPVISNGGDVSIVATLDSGRKRDTISENARLPLINNFSDDPTQHNATTGEVVSSCVLAELPLPVASNPSGETCVLIPVGELAGPVPNMHGMLWCVIH